METPAIKVGKWGPEQTLGCESMRGPQGLQIATGIILEIFPGNTLLLSFLLQRGFVNVVDGSLGGSKISSRHLVLPKILSGRLGSHMSPPRDK